MQAEDCKKFFVNYEGGKLFAIVGSCSFSIPSSDQGEKSSRDEQGACAMLATQLDSFLGGEPVQHRQVQGYESPEFMGLFLKGVSYRVREKGQ